MEAAPLRSHTPEEQSLTHHERASLRRVRMRVRVRVSESENEVRVSEWVRVRVRSGRCRIAELI